MHQIFRHSLDMMETIPNGVLPLAAEHQHPTSHPTAVPDLDPEIVDSPDAISDGTFPSPAQSPVKRRRPDGTRDGKEEMGGRDEQTSRSASPFPLQGPIILDNNVNGTKGNALPSPLSAVVASDEQEPIEEQSADDGHVGKESSAGSRLSMRVAPASPAPSHSVSPALSRRASSQALPSTPITIQILQNGKLVETGPDTPDTSTTDVDQVSVSRSGSLASKTRPRSATTTTGSGSSTRSRRPSTLIPQPGREGETIPPRYRNADGGDANAEGSAVQEDDTVDAEQIETIPVDSAESTTASRDGEVEAARENDQQEVEEPRRPRVTVRDFGFPASDPRYRGAFHPIPGEEEDDEDDDRSTAGSTASGASSGWNRFTGRRKSSLGGGWSGFGFGGFGFGGLSRRFSRSSRRGSQAGLSNADGGDDAESNRSGNGGSRRSSLQVSAAAGPSKSISPGGIVLPPPDTDISLSDLTPSSSVDDEPSFGRQYVFGSGGGTLMRRGNSSGSRLRALSGAGSDTGSHPTSGSVTPLTIPEYSPMDSFATPIATTAAEDPRLSILSQVSEEGLSDASDEAAKWPSDSVVTNSSSVSSGTTVTAPEPKGRYMVLYEFGAEGEHEMSVAEGEVLFVGGRWGNMGWVIAERVHKRDGQVTKGLVPEGYLGDKLSDR